MNKHTTIVAVDGPSASGKSTVSRRTAQAVGFIYVDSGALYRGVTWKCVKEGVDVKDSQAVTNLLIRMNMELVLKDGAVGYLIDGEVWISDPEADRYAFSPFGDCDNAVVSV